MPEPTTAEPSPVTRVRGLLAQAEARTGPNGDALFYNEDVRNLLAAYDKATAAAAETRQWLAESDKVWARRDLAAWEAKNRALTAAIARAAAAEAAVQRIREYGENRIEELLEMRDAKRGSGINRSVSEALEFTACDVRSLLELLPADTVAAPQSDLTSVSGIVNAAPDDQHVSTELFARVPPPLDTTPYDRPTPGYEISPVSTVLNLGDDATVTTEGVITRVEFRANAAGAQWATVTVADLDDSEQTIPVDVAPATYRRIADRLVEGRQVLVRGQTAHRTSLHADNLRNVEDWDGITDENVYADTAPAFESTTAHQFRAGFEQTRRDMDSTDATPVQGRWHL